MRDGRCRRAPEVAFSLIPEYVPATLAADLTAQQPGDNAWGVTEGDVRAQASRRPRRSPANAATVRLVS
jgi:hypothetical protein